MRKLKPNIFLIGDSVDDAGMVNGVKKVLRIILDNPRIDAKHKSGIFYNKMLQKFDLVIKEKSLFPVVDIIKLF